MGECVVINTDYSHPHVVTEIIKTRQDDRKFVKDGKAYPRRLTMLKIGIANEFGGECQFCDTPFGETRTSYISLESREGFVSCGKEECRQNMQNAIIRVNEETRWNDIMPYLSKNVNMKRSNGNMDDDWKVSEFFIILSTTSDGKAFVVVHKFDNDTKRYLEKMVEVDTFFYYQNK